jgi:predicted DNA-binding transcriptional regulator AlpA
MSRRTEPVVSRATLLASLGVSPEDLLGMIDIARMLNVTVRTAQNYIARDDFPEPLGQIAAGRVWLRADVEKWAKETLPLPTGRPRKETDG